MLTGSQTNPQFSPVCGQCKFFDGTQNTCSKKYDRWIYDTTVVLRKSVTVSQPACTDKFIEVVPF